jgi:hypothetical protein
LAGETIGHPKFLGRFDSRLSLIGLNQYTPAEPVINGAQNGIGAALQAYNPR